MVVCTYDAMSLGCSGVALMEMEEIRIYGGRKAVVERSRERAMVKERMAERQERGGEEEIIGMDEKLAVQ